MNKLANFAIANGTYNDLETIIQSKENTIVLINNLEITKQANKKKWATGNLMYTITIINCTNTYFENIIVTDILNPELVSLIVESVRINGIPAGYSNFSYDKSTGLLTFRLPIVEANETIMIQFQVKKNNKEIFEIENYASLTFDSNTITSNVVSTSALSKICKCKELRNNNKIK